MVRLNPNPLTRARTNTTVGSKSGSLSSKLSSHSFSPSVFNETPAKDRESVHEQPHIESLDALSKEVLRRLEIDGAPPIPSNYDVYFERILDEQPENFKRTILNMLDLEGDRDHDRQIDFERHVREGFSHIKKILQHVAVLYKNLTLLQSITAKRLEEMRIAESRVVFENIASMFAQEVEKLSAITYKQTAELKGFYQESAKTINSLDNETIFDARLGIYNRRFLTLQIEKEAKAIGRFRHASTLLMAQIPAKKLAEIGDEKAISLVSRTISRLILKTSRRSDTVAYYGEGIFAMVLKHANIQSAKMASERLIDLINTTHVFIGENEVGLQVVIGISKILSTRDAESTLSLAIDAMKAVNFKQETYRVANIDDDA